MNSTAKPGLILVDDDPLISESLSFVLEQHYTIYSVANRAEANQTMRDLAERPSLALVDLGLPPEPHSPAEGFALIGELLAFNPSCKILVLSGQSERTNIQHALTLGAVDFIPKPCDIELLLARLQHQSMMLDAEQQESETAADYGGMLGESAAMQTLRTQIGQFADTPFPVLIIGESGSGKELVAHSLHEQGGRRDQPFLSINCAAFPAELLEAQLFGHAKGAFTGADQARAGFFEEAGDGTLFLDEIGDMPMSLQSKLLRVLENGEYYRIGETGARTSTARIVAATNQDLRTGIQAGDFRADLYHRLGVLTIDVPPLRERGDDVALLLAHFTQLYSGSVKPFSLDDDATQRLLAYPFHGNVRELRNVVIRLGAKYPGQRVGVAQLEAELETDVQQPLGDAGVQSDEQLRQQLAAGNFSLDEQLGQQERRYINAALAMSNSNLSQAARLLGVNRTTLHSRIQRLESSDKQA